MFAKLLFRGFLIVFIWLICLATIKKTSGELIIFSKCLKSGSKLVLNINITDAHCKGIQKFNRKINPCFPNPCLYGGRCYMYREGYRCVNCPYPMGGLNCNELDCNGTCFRINETVYFGDSLKTMSWEIANNTCSSKNMTLAVIKNKNSQKLLRRFLLAVSQNFNAERAYWIGLSRKSVNERWKWEDGSYLQEFPELTNEHSLCAAIDLYSGQIYSSKCIRTVAFDHFPLCQKQYPFLAIRNSQKLKIHPCEPNPCLHGSQCQIAFKGHGHNCINCPFPLGGQNCDEFQCDGGCFIVNETLYYLHLGQQRSWTDAYHKCLDSNMSLVVISNAETHKAIKIHLYDLKSEGLYHGESLWIGLTRTFTFYPWTWVDGSRLNNRQQSWDDGYPVEGLCAAIGHENDAKLNMYDLKCDEVNHYAFCQKTL
ncbi:hypothetical protein CHUAL_012463 [Chamberlinius hualienensis]